MSTGYTSGQRVKLDYNGQTIEAVVLLASGNSRSLMLRFSGALAMPGGGLMVGLMPLLMDGAGIYRDLADDAPATLSLWEGA